MSTSETSSTTSCIKPLGHFQYSPMSQTFSAEFSFRAHQDHLRSRTGIVEISPGFRNLIGPVRIRNCKRRVVTYHNLSRGVMECQLEKENRGVYVFALTADCLDAMLLSQRDGRWNEKLPLLTDGRLNIIPVVGAGNRQCAVRARWKNGWKLDAMVPQRHMHPRNTRLIMGHVIPR